MTAPLELDPPVTQLYAEDKDLKIEDVQILQEWLSKQPHLPQVSERAVAKMLHSCYYRIEPTKEAIDRYYTLTSACPAVFAPLPEDLLRKTASVGFVKILPKLTPKKYYILMVKLTDLKLENFHFLNLVRLIAMTIIWKINHVGLVWGSIALFDLQGVSLGHLTRFDLMGLKRILEFVQEAAPVRIQGLHFINIVPFMDKLLAIVKPFLGTELYNRIQLHNSIETLYKEVPKECLPKDYGGDSSSIKTLSDENVSDLINATDFFKWHEQQKTNESKRPTKSINAGQVFGMEGTFKKLQLD